MTTTRYNKQLWNHGQTMVEFGMSVTAFFILVFCTINASRVIYAYDFVSYVAREGSRYASVHGKQSRNPASSDDIKNLVLGEVQGLDSKSVNVKTTWTPDNKPGSVVSVQVQYTWKYGTPYVNFAPITLTSTSTMFIDN